MSDGLGRVKKFKYLVKRAAFDLLYTRGIFLSFSILVNMLLLEGQWVHKGLLSPFLLKKEEAMFDPAAVLSWPQTELHFACSGGFLKFKTAII